MIQSIDMLTLTGSSPSRGRRKKDAIKNEGTKPFERVLVAYISILTIYIHMARITKPPPGKLLVSFIYSHIDALAESLKKVERQFGPVEFETLDFDCADKLRYSEEMGLSLQRRFFSFEKLVDRSGLVALKKATAKIEPDFADEVGDHLFRTVNIDPMILSPDNLIVASARAANHRAYFADGIYADMQLVWSRGQYVQLPWTDEDFCHDEVIDLLTRVRATFELVDSSYQKIVS